MATARDQHELQTFENATLWVTFFTSSLLGNSFLLLSPAHLLFHALTHYGGLGWLCTSTWLSLKP